jgi:hypothetical protein
MVTGMPENLEKQSRKLEKMEWKTPLRNCE